MRYNGRFGDEMVQGINPTQTSLLEPFRHLRIDLPNSAPDPSLAADTSSEILKSTLAATSFPVLLERIDGDKNEARFYLVSVQPTLFSPISVVRIYGRKGVSQNVRITPMASLADARKVAQKHVDTRLRHGYSVARLGGGQ